MGNFTSSVDTGILTFFFEGELDTICCMEIGDKVLNQMKEHKEKVVFDLKGVDYISSSFIRLCGSAASLVTSSNISLVNMNKEIKKNLTKIGLAAVLNIK